MRASLTDTIPSAGSAYRYDWPSPHAAGTVFADAAVFSAGCNGGVAIGLNPIGYHPYYRALILGLERQLGVKSAARAGALPPSAGFSQVAPAATLTGFNPLPGETLTVPATDSNGVPVGGVRFPDADLPLGRPVPPSLPPVSTAPINATCGNYGGFEPFSAAQLTALYGSDTQYAAAYDAALKTQIAAGYVLSEDETRMVAAAQALYDAIAAL